MKYIRPLLHISLKQLLVFVIITMSFIVTAQEQVYIQRLAQLRSQTDLIYKPEVKKFIDLYLQNPDKTKELISLSKYYFPLLEKQLRAKGLPTDLKYLALSASELNPQFVSPSGASGIWSMSFPVSRMYKLKVNTFVDERRDPNISSAVFAQHFKDLFSIYKSWPLVIGAYGCSPTTMNKCIRMASNSLYFWDIYPFLPAVCRDAYPQFIAAVYIINYYKEHGIKPNNIDLNMESDSVLVNKPLSFEQIASTLGVTVNDLRTLNPIFKKDIIPMSTDGYYVKLPKTKSRLFYLLKDSVYKPINTEVTPVIIQQEEPKEEAATAEEVVVSEPKEEKEKKKKKGKDTEEETASKTKTKESKVTYVVKKGDIVNDIADWFDCNNADIKKWNKLKSNKVQKGKKLTLYVAANKTGYYKRINKMSNKEKKKLKRKD